MSLAAPTDTSAPEAPLGSRGSTASRGSRARGPLRPEVLSPVRTRMTRRMLSLGFRVVDILCLAALAAGALWASGGSIRAMCAFVIVAVVAMACLPLFGAYGFRCRETSAKTLLRVAAAVLPAPVLAILVALAAASAWARDLAFATAAILVLLSATHLVALKVVRRWRRDGRLTPNVLVVGATDDAARLIESAMAGREVAVLGIFDDRSARVGPNVHGVPVLGDTETMMRHRVLPFVDRIVLTVNAAGPARTAELIERLRVLPNELCLLLDGQDPKSRSATLEWLSRSTLAGGREAKVLAKRAQDLVLGAILLILSLPVMALVAIAIRLDSPGPVLFRQRRHGFNNEEITVWKFRSMRTDATDSEGARQVSAGDDRVTRVGRFIRRTSLDELPQFFNVIGGAMSLVGPRPHPVGMKTAGQDSARLVAEYAWRHRMKPGITGWAQINGSRGPVETAEEVRRRVELDVDYIERQSFAFDLYVVAMTLPRLLGDRGTVR